MPSKTGYEIRRRPRPTWNTLSVSSTYAQCVHLVVHLVKTQSMTCASRVPDDTA